MSVGPNVVKDGLKVQVDFGNKNTFDPVPTSLPLALDSSTDIINTAPNTGNVLGNASPQSTYTYYQCYDVAKSATAGVTGNTDGDPGEDVYRRLETSPYGSSLNMYWGSGVGSNFPNLPNSGANFLKLNGFVELVDSGSLVPGAVYYLRHSRDWSNPTNPNITHDGFFRFHSNHGVGTQTPEPNRDYFFEWIASHNSFQRGSRVNFSRSGDNDDFQLFNAEYVGKWGYEGYLLANEYNWSTTSSLSHADPEESWVSINHNQGYAVDTDPFTIEIWFRMRDLPTAEYGHGTPIYGDKQGSNYMLFCYPKNGSSNSQDKSNLGACYDDSRYNDNHRTTAEIGQMEWVQFVHCHHPYNGLQGQFEYYINGVLDTALTNSADTSGFAVPNTLYIGRDTRYTVQSRVDMAIIRHYNKVLTPAEVKQNFNANRGRFGL